MKDAIVAVALGFHSDDYLPYFIKNTIIMLILKVKSAQGLITLDQLLCVMYF
jgi:hypothetical protein